MKTEFGQAIMAALGNEQKTQTWLAAESGVTQSALNHLINKGYRPKRETLAPICQAFDRPDGLDVLCGHLRDEIHAAGYRRSEIVLSTRPAECDGELERAVDDLMAVAHQRRDVAQLLLDLAALARQIPEAETAIRAERQHLLAADPADPGEPTPAPGKPITYPVHNKRKKK
jgi:transcriptional regulator with XRE-family HTH domain